MPIPEGFPFVFFACLAFFGIPLTAYFARKKTYAKTEYRFFRDRVEYYEGFFTIEQKTALYRNVMEINLRKGIIQRRYGLGTIVLTTPGAAVSRSMANPFGGIRIRDVREPDEVYAKVKEAVDAARRGRH